MQPSYSAPLFSQRNPGSVPCFLPFTLQRRVGIDNEMKLKRFSLTMGCGASQEASGPAPGAVQFAQAGALETPLVKTVEQLTAEATSKNYTSILFGDFAFPPTHDATFSAGTFYFQSKDEKNSRHTRVR